MELNLRVTNRQGQTPPREVRLELAQDAITIGRGLSNDLCLDDSERVVSGSHARIELRDGGIWITDTSRNGTYLNNAADPIPSHQCVALYDGDRLSIGPFDVVVGFGEAPGASQDEIADPFAEDDGSDLGDLGRSDAPADILDLLDPGAGHGGGDLLPDLPSERNLPGDAFGDAAPLDDGLAGPPPQAPPRGAPHRHTPVEHVFYRPAEQQSIPENYDLLSDAWVGSGEGGSAPDTPQEPSDPFARAVAHPEPPDLPELPPEPDAERTDLIPELQEQAPPPRRPEPPRPPAYRPQPPAGGELAAFLEGLGLGRSTEVRDPQAFMRLSGELMRIMAAGLVQTMRGRAEFKDEIGAGVTIIRAAENNPFKFSANTADLIDRLLLRPSAGYLPAAEAAREALDDIQAHEMAMTAGLRAALHALFARFEPSRLEQRLGRASGLDQLLTMARKAKYWDLFNEEYEKVAADASEDFMQLFRESFTRAYLDQVQRLREARRRG